MALENHKLKGRVLLESQQDLSPSKNFNPFEFKPEHPYVLKLDEDSIEEFKNIQSMLSSVQLMLRQALNSFARLDTTETIEVLEKDKEVDEEYRSYMRQLLTYMLEDPRTISMSLELMIVTKSLERIGDHAKNITQSVIYTVKGTDVRHSSIKEIKAKLKH